MIDLSDFLNTYPGLFSENIGSNNTTPNNRLSDSTGISPAAINYDQLISSSSSNDPSRTFLNQLDSVRPHDIHQNTEDRLGQIIRSSGLEAFNYSESEREMSQWINTKIPEPSKTKMRTLWNESQNLFSATTSQQSAEDLKEAEYQFQRNLVTCLSILDTLPIPGCMWRRTGEICQTNQQFNHLVGIHSFPCFSLLSSFDNPHQKKSGDFIKIHQLWDIDSGLNFLEKFNRIALDEGQKAVLTSCVLHRFKEKEDGQSARRRAGDQQRLPSPSSCSTLTEAAKQKEPLNVCQDSASQKPDSGEVSPFVTTQHAHHHSSEPTPPHKRDDASNFLDDAGKNLFISDYINCTFSFTVRRDSFGLPCLIIGNFLPS